MPDKADRSSFVPVVTGRPKPSLLPVAATASGTWSATAQRNIAETLALSGTTGVEIVGATVRAPDELELVDRTADLILLSRDALAAGLERSFTRPERIRAWTYEFDPAGLEHLRRAIEHVAETRPATEPV